MRDSALHRCTLAWALLSLCGVVVPTSTQAQETRGVLAKQISVGDTDASLVVEFRDGGRFEVALRDGSVSIDGAAVGSYEPGAALEDAWRSLLGEAIRLENGALAQALYDWTPPEDLSSDVEGATAQALDRALEAALMRPLSPDAPTAGDADPPISESRALTRLLTRSLGRLDMLEEALAGASLGPDLRVFVDEDFTLEEGDRVEGTVLVIDGRARVDGTVDGDLVVIDGSVEIAESGRIEGALRTVDTRLIRNLGTVEGGVVDVLASAREAEDTLRERLRSEIRDEIRSDLRRELRNVTRARDDGFSLLAPVRSVLRGVGGLIQGVLIILVLGLIGAAAVHFAGSEFEVVSDAARKSPGRAAAVGLAGVFLALPVWVLGTVALVVSIVGIPVALAWIPLFPAALALAGLIGLVAVAHNVGRWLARENYPWSDRIRASNPVHTIFAGLTGLMLAFLAADAISILPFMGFLSGLLTAFGALVTTAAMLVGFGAVVLTRAGRRPDTWEIDPDEAWAAAMGMDPEPDQPAERASHAGSTGKEQPSDEPGPGPEARRDSDV